MNISLKESLKRVKEAIAAYRNGEMLIVMDDEDRENEGDLVLAGIFSTPEKINFMAKYARGLICVCITPDLANKLDLPPMVARNDSNHETAFTVSIDAREAKTGISAFERDMTINLLCDDNARSDDFVRPGHIFPLVAKDGGVLVRTGHTEAGIDLCRLAGLKPVSVICEIMKDDGTMAGHGDKFLLDFAKEHQIKILYISDLIAYRMQNENLLKMMESGPVEFLSHRVKRYDFCDHLGRVHSALEFMEDRKKNPLVRFEIIHSDFERLSDYASYLYLLRCVEKLAKDGGVLIFLQDSGVKDGVVKNFGIGAQVLKSLHINEFYLITSSKREFSALGGFDLKIIDYVNI